MQINVLEAKTEFSKLIRLLETKREQSITVARNGKPVVIMTLYPEQPASGRIGAAKNRFHDPVEWEKYDEEIAASLTGGSL